MATATANPFHLLVDFDNDDPSLLIAARPKKAAAVAPPRTKKALPPTRPGAQQPAKLPSKPLPPAEAVRDAKAGAGGGRGGSQAGGGRGSGRGRGRSDDQDGYGNSDNSMLENGFRRGLRAPEDIETERRYGRERAFSNSPRDAHHHGRGRRGGYSNREVEEEDEEGLRPSRKLFDRHSQYGAGNVIKREGHGQYNWGTLSDQGPTKKPEEFVNSVDKHAFMEKTLAEEEDGAVINQENMLNRTGDKEAEEKEMTLGEYEKLVEEKRKALQALQRTEERKVDIDKEFESMQQLSAKKSHDDIFINLRSEKELGKRKDVTDKDELSKKAVNINELLISDGAGRFYTPGLGGRGRGGHGFSGGLGGSSTTHIVAPSIEDSGQFPTLGAGQE